MFNVPDNINRILIAIGVILIAYGYLEQDKERKEYNVKVLASNAQKDSLNEKIDLLNIKKREYLDISNRISKRNKVENPFSGNDSFLVFKEIFLGNNSELKVNDSLYKLFLAFKNENELIALRKNQLDVTKQNLKDAEESYEDDSKFHYALAILGLLLFFSGFVSLNSMLEKENQLKFIETNGQKKYYPRCQSCAKKFSSIITYGTNKDETYNSAYCRLCLKNGEFTEPDLTKNEVVNRIVATRKKRLGFFAKEMINNLDRWKINHYN